MAKEYTLAASAARTASGTGTTVWVGSYWQQAVVVHTVSAATHEHTDTLDVYVDVSPDGSKWLNAAHYAQQLGDGAAKTEFVVLCPVDPGTSTINATSDCGAGVSRPAAHGKYMRARWVVSDSGDGDASFTFSVKAYA
jgi:hypothetical protein